MVCGFGVWFFWSSWWMVWSQQVRPSMSAVSRCLVIVRIVVKLLVSNGSRIHASLRSRRSSCFRNGSGSGRGSRSWSCTSSSSSSSSSRTRQPHLSDEEDKRWLSGGRRRQRRGVASRTHQDNHAKDRCRPWRTSGVQACASLGFSGCCTHTGASGRHVALAWFRVSPRVAGKRERRLSVALQGPSLEDVS